MEVHTWKERTEEGTLVYRACHHAGKWKLECAPKVGRAERDDVEWEHVELTRAHWVTLRDVLWRKYQRKRCPWRNHRQASGRDAGRGGRRFPRWEGRTIGASFNFLPCGEC